MTPEARALLDRIDAAIAELQAIRALVRDVVYPEPSLDHEEPPLEEPERPFEETA
jgi:hypothetical protein